MTTPDRRREPTRNPARPAPLTRWSGAPLLVCVAVLALLAAAWSTPVGAQAPAATPPNSSPPAAPALTIDPTLHMRGIVTDAPAAAPPLRAGEQPAQTTVVPRTPPKTKAAKPATPPDKARVTCTALLTDDGQQIDQGLIWRVFEDAPGKTKPIIVSRDATAQFTFKPGAYIINVAFGRANLTRKIAVKAGSSSTETFVLNAGGLRLEAVLDRNQKPPPNAIAYDIFSDERDQSGNRTRIMTAARPGLIVRLNAGIYHVVSTYGDANASVETDITVEAGKLTLVRVQHPAARVTFKLVARAGGDALADTQWLLMTPQGEHVKESVGALPSHIIAPGAYIIVAKQAGKAFRRSFAVQAGDIAQVEVVMQ